MSRSSLTQPAPPLFIDRPLERRYALPPSYALSLPANRALKRITDIAISLLVITTLLWWMLPVLALLIRATSSGPVFFRQRRTGLYYKPFTCIKLRTMFVNNHADAQQATAGDPRITIAGRFLRKFSLDELPQFFNVLTGDMSVIGPRPHMIRHTYEYSGQVDNFSLRHLVRPGITGLSQIEGYRGEIKDQAALNQRIRLDNQYIEQWSMALDLKIMFRTIKLLVFGDQNAY